MTSGGLSLQPITVYNAFGSFVVIGKDASQKFIAFLHSNTDAGHRVEWADMTGREQTEWIECWMGPADRSYGRMEDLTNGLRGTDPDRITTPQQLNAALVRSPTFRNRRPQGAYAEGSPFNNAVWDVEVARLFH